MQQAGYSIDIKYTHKSTLERSAKLITRDGVKCFEIPHMSEYSIIVKSRHEERALFMVYVDGIEMEEFKLERGVKKINSPSGSWRRLTFINPLKLSQGFNKCKQIATDGNIKIRVYSRLHSLRDCEEFEPCTKFHVTLVDTLDIPKSVTKEVVLPVAATVEMFDQPLPDIYKRIK